jgi:hypothetical protein
MNLDQLKQIISDLGGDKIYTKKLAPNDNSKNQVYFGGSFEILNVLPVTEITSDSSGDWKRERFKAGLNFGWIQDDGKISNAPKAQLILYPKYPEVRFSGFLSNCENAPSNLMATRLAERILLFSVLNDGRVIGYVVSPESEIANEINSLSQFDEYGIFKVITLPKFQDHKIKLIQEFKRIHDLGWIDSKRLDRNGNVLPCNSSNCGGYTLEAELGVTPNGFSEPDFLGWEIKQFGVSTFNHYKNSVITLMTPEPTGGMYTESGVDKFIYKYGYKDQRGREDRLNFGGIHKVGSRHSTTNLEMKIIGFDFETNKIRNADGFIGLFDKDDNIAANWSFSSMLKHWNRKHNQACYIPSQSHLLPLQYYYSDFIILGIGTDFQLFLNEMVRGNIYYDPGIKMENVSSHPVIKRRSQFRIKSANLVNLYKQNEIVNLADY